jgi:hypothetical protein
MPITDFEKYANLTSDNKDLTADFKPLNFDALMKAGALRVTHQGSGSEKYNPDPNAGFSLVSGYNDALGGNTPQWKDNPSAYATVQNMLQNTPENIGAHKYLQIIESAKDLGMTPEQIYAQPSRKQLIEQQINSLPE